MGESATVTDAFEARMQGVLTNLVITQTQELKVFIVTEIKRTMQECLIDYSKQQSSSGGELSSQQSGISATDGGVATGRDVVTVGVEILLFLLMLC